MAKKKLIVVWPYRFRDFDWQRFELEFLAPHVEIHVHELIDALTPEFAAAYANQSENPVVKRFGSLKEWRHEFKKISKDAIVFSHVRPTNLKSTLICLILRLSGCKIVGFSTGGTPNYASTDENGELKIVSSFKAIYHLFKRNIFRLTSPNQILAGGSEEVKRARRDNSRKSEIICGSSSDYSQSLRYEKSLGKVGEQSVFLDTGFPGFQRDELLEGKKEHVRPDQWYPKLSSLLEFVDQTLHYDTQIAVHPKHVGRDHKEFFGSKRAIGNQTMNLVANSPLVIATNSTSISYAVAFGKPLILVTCDAIEDSRQRKRLEIRNCAFETGARIFNIDREYTEKDLRDALVIDHAKRESYKRKYLTSRIDDKPNYQVLLDEVINPKK